MSRRWLPVVLVCVLCLAAMRPMWAAPADDDDPEQTKAEIKIGRDATKQFDRHMKIISSGPDVERLRRILKKLAPVSGRTVLPYTVKIVESPMVNAITFPGGFIYVFRGLLAQNLDDDMMAGVLGHEVAHAARSHTYRTLLQMQALGAITGGQGGLVAGVTNVVLMRGVGRTYEYQADKLGVQFATAAGYNPRGLLKSLFVLKKLSHDQPGLLTGLVDTHPPIDLRIKKVEAQLKAMGK